jgi:hypothetical protein
MLLRAGSPDPSREKPVSALRIRSSWLACSLVNECGRSTLLRGPSTRTRPSCHSPSRVSLQRAFGSDFRVRGGELSCDDAEDAASSARATRGSASSGSTTPSRRRAEAGVRDRPVRCTAERARTAGGMGRMADRDDGGTASCRAWRSRHQPTTSSCRDHPRRALLTASSPCSCRTASRNEPDNFREVVVVARTVTRRWRSRSATASGAQTDLSTRLPDA